jgi:hypothetical protein
MKPESTENEFDEFDWVSWLHLNKEDSDMCVIAIDPGDTHIGVSIGVANPIREHSQIVYSLEMERQAALEYVQDMITAGWVDILIAEDFTLIPDKAMAQSGSPMLTSQMIGALDWMIRQDCRCRNPNESIGKFVKQSPRIKKTMRALLVRHGIKPIPSGNSGHARDSQLHFWYYALHLEGLNPDPRWNKLND